jgi:hypothetical protein
VSLRREAVNAAVGKHFQMMTERIPAGIQDGGSICLDGIAATACVDKVLVLAYKLRSHGL